MSTLENVSQKIRDLLNGLASHNFDTQSSQLFTLEIPNSEETLRTVVETIYSKASRDHQLSRKYANLCKKISDQFQRKGNLQSSCFTQIPFKSLLIWFLVFVSCS
jgi:hypothetical protein